MWTVELVVMLAMIAVNALFAAYEIALASVSVGRLELLAQENRRGARAGLHMKQNIEASLATVQLGITLVAAIARVSSSPLFSSTVWGSRHPQRTSWRLLPSWPR
jgi:putative hemolysin